MKFIFWFIVILLVATFSFYFVFNHYHENPPANNSINYCLKYLNASSTDWQILILSTYQDTDVSGDSVWKEFSDLNEWSSWANPLVISAEWVKGNDWLAGNTFKQKLNLGFPLGEKEFEDTISDVKKKEKVVSTFDSQNIKSCHIWNFELMADKRTRITDTEIFYGRDIGVSKPFVAGTWQKMFEDSLDGLIQRAINNN